MGLFKQLENAANDAANNAAAGGQQAADNITNAATQAANTVVNAGQQAANNIAGAAQGSAQTVRQEAEAVAEVITATAQKAANTVADEGRRAAAAVAGEGRRIMSLVASEVSRAAASVDGLKIAGHDIGGPTISLPALRGPGSRNRLMNQAEIDLATSVFQNSLPYDRIYLSPHEGIGGNPFTLPQRDGSYVIHLGVMFAAPLNTTVPRTNGNNDVHTAVAFLIHELTHVWQGEHWLHHDYVADATQHLITEGTRAYHYDLGKKWTDYHAEQQAAIVEDWFAVPFVPTSAGDSMSQSSPRFDFIRDNIRRGINDPAHPRNAVG